jgi:hypothetical protein
MALVARWIGEAEVAAAAAAAAAAQAAKMADRHWAASMFVLKHMTNLRVAAFSC